MNIFLLLFLLIFSISRPTNCSINPDQTTVMKNKETMSLTKRIRLQLSSALEKVQNSPPVKKASKKALSTLLKIIEGTKIIFSKNHKKKFCPISPRITYAPTIDDEAVMERDYEQMIPIIRKYSPIIYLFNEKYLPVAVEDYFLNPTTCLVYEKDKKHREIVIPEGQITMEKIYEYSKKYKGPRFYFDIRGCTKYGSNPQRFSDKNGNLTTPIYVTWTFHKDKVYIVYGFTYSFNGAYPITAPISDIRLFQTGAHEFDLEYIILEVDTESKELERIYFSAHTSKEGVWVPANHKDLLYEEGSHPVVHSAHNGHGSYPREGTHVRLYGFGNDITSRTYKTQRWVPQIVLIYPDTDERFDPKTMGWAFHSGDYGRRGVGSYKRFIGETGLSKGQPYENVVFCPNPKDPTNTLDWIKYRMRITKMRKDAKLPKRATVKK